MYLLTPRQKQKAILSSSSHCFVNSNANIANQSSKDHPCQITAFQKLRNENQQSHNNKAGSDLSKAFIIMPFL